MVNLPPFFDNLDPKISMTQLKNELSLQEQRLGKVILCLCFAGIQVVSQPRSCFALQMSMALLPTLYALLQCILIQTKGESR